MEKHEKEKKSVEYVKQYLHSYFNIKMVNLKSF